jgi:hypothetical protein
MDFGQANKLSSFISLAEARDLFKLDRSELIDLYNSKQSRFKTGCGEPGGDSKLIRNKKLITATPFGDCKTNTMIWKD